MLWLVWTLDFGELAGLGLLLLIWLMDLAAAPIFRPRAPQYGVLAGGGQPGFVISFLSCIELPSLQAALRKRVER